MSDPWKTFLERRRKLREEELFNELWAKMGFNEGLRGYVESYAKLRAKDWAEGAAWCRELTDTMRLANKIQGSRN